LKLEGKLYHQGEIKEAAIEIEDGKIKRIRKSLPSARKFKGIILPGALDLHVHFREPGFVYKEDFYTGTMSAAFGGVTFVMDMPNNSPAVITAENFMDKLRIVSPKANVDFSLYFMLTHHSSSLEEINGAFKYYMGETTAAEGREIKEFPKKSFISVHAELNECIRRKSTDLEDHDRARPEKCEFFAVKSLLDYNIKFHIAHVSSIDTVDLCKIGSFTCEVTPHHLFLHKDMPLGAFGKVNPPLRAKWVSEQLWEELLSGRIDMVASDHAPHALEDKAEEFSRAPSGIPEVETYVPIFLYLVKMGRIPIKRAVEVLMERPGELIGLNKGKIEEGYDADLIIVDFSNVRKIRSRDLHYKCGWTPYENFYGIFPHTVFLRGKAIVEEHEFVGERMGEFRRIERKNRL